MTRAWRSSWTAQRIVRLLLAVVTLGIIAAELVFVVPRIAASGRALAHLRWHWLALALFAEAASMANFARLQRRMLRVGGVQVSLRRSLAVTYAANALSVTLPGGSLLSSGYTFRRMRSWGAQPSVASWGLVASGVLSTISLALIGVVGASIAGGDSVNPVLIAIEAVLAVSIVVALHRVARRPERLVRVGAWATGRFNRLRHRPVTTGQRTIERLIAELALVRPRVRDWALGLVFAAANWLGDVLCLVAACHAVGARGPSVGLALLAYAAGMAAATVPLMPGGLGIVDGALILALVHGEIPAVIATAGVIVYRVISLGLVAGAGWCLWLFMRRADRALVLAEVELANIRPPFAAGSDGTVIDLIVEKPVADDDGRLL